MPTPSDRAGQSGALTPVPVDPRPVTPNDVAIEALATMQGATSDLEACVRRLSEMLDDLQTPARITTIVLTSTQLVSRDEVGDEPSLSIGVVNPSAADVFLGIGGTRATKEGRALGIPGGAAIVLPVSATDLELGTEAADVAAGDAVLFLLRFKAVQPFFFGRY